MRCVVVSSPTARADPRVALARAGVEVVAVLRVERLPSDLAIPPDVDVVVAAGGDGTVGATAARIAGGGPPLGILPLGTSNDVARALGVPYDLDAACAVVASAPPRPVDLGRARFPGGTTYFMHALGFGAHAEWCRLASDRARRERLGGLTYAASTLDVARRVRPAPLRLTLLGPAGDVAPVWIGEAWQLTVVNVNFFGGRLGLRLPGEHTPGTLDVVVLARGPRGWPLVRRFRARGAVVGGRGAVSVDGEPWGRAPLVVDLAPEPIRVVLPP